jgi:hypothetical protein
MKNFYSAVAVRASVDMRNRADLYRAVTPGGDFASTGRNALGVLLSNASSGQAVQVGIFGELPFLAGGVCSFGYALTISTSGAFVGMTPANHEVGVCLGADAVDAQNVNSGAVGAGFLVFGPRPYAAPASGGAFA